MAILIGIGVACYFIMILAGGLESMMSTRRATKKNWIGAGLFVIAMFLVMIDILLNAGGMIALFLAAPAAFASLVLGIG